MDGTSSRTRMGCLSIFQKDRGHLTVKAPAALATFQQKKISFMKHSITVFLDSEILRLVKQRAAEERRPLGELIQEALAKLPPKIRNDA